MPKRTVHREEVRNSWLQKEGEASQTEVRAATTDESDPSINSKVRNCDKQEKRSYHRANVNSRTGRHAKRPNVQDMRENSHLDQQRLEDNLN
ncbi:hypothetical protein ACHWQZ_G015161 [Mnemiopsis leidyi]